MPTAHLHDGSTIDVTVLGAGDHPTVLLPVSTSVLDGPAADEMRAWGTDPNLGHSLATALSEAGLRVVAADYEGHLTDHPQPATLTPANVAADLLAIADAADAPRFAYYGYSWLAVCGLQLALRTDRLTALALGGYPPLAGPYEDMLAVTRVAHRMAVANRDDPPPPPAATPEPGDWESYPFTRTVEQTQQYVTLYEALRDFDDRAALDRLDLPRLAFAGENDVIEYGPAWDDARVDIAGPLRAHRDELIARGWRVELIPGADHLAAMQPGRVLPILLPWLATACRVWGLSKSDPA